MPRAVKPKAPGALADKKSGPAKKAKGKLYAMPEKLKEGTVLTDLAKGQWRIGPSIGIGGFGEIYAASRVGDKSQDAVVKCEPHGNGPLFVEMHFYLRNAKMDDIKQFKQQHGLKELGMPYILANGSADVNGQKHRFIVMPRYGSDVSKFYIENGKRLPEGTVYRLAIQMLDVYQFMHSTGYVHADLKAANILLGLDKGGASQAYLVDFGLASHYVTGDFKPDPKKMHNGTIEYTSRDAHMGVPTRRADLEILGYNLIEWLGIELPWVRDKLLGVPLKVQKAKESFMNDVGTSLKQLFPQGVSAAIGDYMKYVSKLAHNEAPDYDKCRQWFLNALKQMKIPNSGELEFKLKPHSSNNNESSPPKTKPNAVRKVKKDSPRVMDSSTDDIIYASDEEEKVLPKKRSPADKRKLKPPTVSPKKRALQAKSQNSPRVPATDLSSSKSLSGTPNSKLNCSPGLSLRSSGRPGKTVINDDLTPNPRSKKTYEFNFELDVSMDANVIVNVKRKKKAGTGEQPNDVNSPSSSSSKAVKINSASAKDKDSPVKRINLRKLINESGAASPSTAARSHSPRTPAVTVRKYRR
ncbi:uncharacterized protein Dwil_GK13744 [Drosophila willistoni]|uniref:non-specific serine/threonine protein kinase n=1 Tax=Drosophila willistoni TaxID=7260 RepID=B4NIA5_DROWI|nr:nucleosomal histone kinase 1 [Drosophila willistoni]EDW83687.1 uncharacterized protein Dwil_GK13744 [Drosophila willistoni]